MSSGEGRAITVSIVIITKDTRELLEGCLRSVEKDSSLVSLGIETIIIDNASNDGTDSMVREGFPDAIYIRNDANAGFAAAVNRAGRAARGKYILLLNSDTLLIEGEAAKMISCAESIDNLGILGPQLVYDDLSNQRSTARIPGLMQEFIPGSRRVKSNYLPGHAVADVESLIGAAVLIRKTAFDEVNGFDERFFFFLEETDFCVRLLQHRPSGRFLPRGQGGPSAGKDSSKDLDQGPDGVQYFTEKIYPEASCPPVCPGIRFRQICKGTDVCRLCAFRAFREELPAALPVLLHTR